MGKLQRKADEYHEQFAARIIKALEQGTAPWQKAWKLGERILRQRARLPGRQRRVPRHERDGARLRRSVLGRLPADPGGRRARPQGREGYAHHVR